MVCRLLAIDIDGTLLDSRGELSDANRAAIGVAERAGIRVVLVTGRRLPSARQVAERAASTGPLVVNNGALIVQSAAGGVLHRRLLPLAAARAIIAAGQSVGLDPIVHDGPNGEGRIFFERMRDPAGAMAGYVARAADHAVRVADLAGGLASDPVQVMFAGTIARIARFHAELRPRLNRMARLARTVYPRRDIAFLDVLERRCSKGRAVAWLAQAHGIARQEIAAVGDNHNDVEMLRVAGRAFVVANAEPAVRARGYELTASNDEDGVARAIERLLEGRT